jgi:hypothetical protein
MFKVEVISPGRGGEVSPARKRRERLQISDKPRRGDIRFPRRSRQILFTGMVPKILK